VTGRLLTPHEVADRAQLSPATIRRLCSRRVIRGATKLAGQWRIPEDSYRAWVQAGEPEPGVVRPPSLHRMPAATTRSPWRLEAIDGGGSG
jgi:hypothetical protein